ncbi:MAG: prepilin peptidase [Candidatus Firestonebacteria bacterium]
MIEIFIFCFGAIIGSFLNVCIYRIPKECSLIFPNSFCPNCKKPIKWFDNIPLFSYIVLGGKCRNCKEKISIKYLTVELISAILFILLYEKFGISLEFLSNIILFSFLIVIAFIDLEHQLIFDITSFPLVIIGLVFSLILPERDIVHSLIGMLVGSVSLLIVGYLSIIFFKKEGMGLGDVKLAAGIGTFLGWKGVLLTLISSFFLGAIIGGILILLKKEKLGGYIPFGPFIALSNILVVLWGNEIMNLVLPIFQIYG